MALSERQVVCLGFNYMSTGMCSSSMCFLSAGCPARPMCQAHAQNGQQPVGARSNVSVQASVKVARGQAHLINGQARDYTVNTATVRKDKWVRKQIKSNGNCADPDTRKSRYRTKYCSGKSCDRVAAASKLV
jgi:hypothetical protein